MRHIFATIVLLTSICAPTALAVDVVAVCPETFRGELAPWLLHRRSEGLEVVVVPSQNTAEQLRSAIQTASDGDTRYVILIGDSPAIGTPCNALRQVPILYSPTKVTKVWGSPPTLSTDAGFGDFDNDLIPDAVVGRLPVDDSGQLKNLVSRIIARDNSTNFGHWRGRVQLVGGIGGFGMLADKVIESVTRNVVTSVLPTSTRTHVVYASPGHAFYPRKPFTESVLENYQHGSRFWVYAGHGQVTQLDRVPQTATGIPVLDPRSVQRLDRPAGESPIAVMLACYTGAMDAGEDSIAEEMLLTPGGPIAVLAGSRVTMPYGNATAAVGLIDAVYEQQLPRLGDAWLSAMSQMHQDGDAPTTTTRTMIDTLATMISPQGTKLVDERREHIVLYNLIGDPTLRLHHPLPIAIGIETGYDAGETISFDVRSPIAGELRIELDRPLGAVFEGDPNRTTIAALDSQVVAQQPAKPKFLLPDDVSGPIIVRAFVKGTAGWATGAAKTIIREKPVAAK